MVMRTPRARWVYLVGGAAFAFVVYSVVQIVYDWELDRAGLLATSVGFAERASRAPEIHFLSIVAFLVLSIAAANGVYIAVRALGLIVARTERQAGELQLVNDLSARLSGRLDAVEIAFEFTAAVRRALGDTATVAILVIDEDLEGFRAIGQAGPRAAALSGATYRTSALPARLREIVVAGRQALVVPDTAADPERWGLVTASGFALLEGVRSFALIPLVAREDIVGALLVVDEEAGKLSEERLRVPTILGRTVAGALLATRSVVEAEDRAQRDALATRVARLTLSSLDADTVLVGAVETLGAAMRASRATVWLGAATDDLRVRAEWRGDGVASVGSGLKQLSTARLAARGAATVTIGDARTDQRLDDPALRTTGDPRDPGDTLAALATPIQLGSQLAGALVVEQVNRTRVWSSAEIRLVEGVARELRTAVETVRLFEARRHEAERMVALNRVSAVLAAQTDPSAVFEEILKNATQLLPLTSASLYTWEEEANVLRLVRDFQRRGEDGPPMLRSEEGVAGRAFATLAPVIVNDYQHWEGRIRRTAESGQRAAIGVPLIRSGKPLGALVLRSYDERARFTEEDARLLGLFADQAVSALASAEAFQRQATVMEDLERLSRAKSDFISIVSHEFRTPLTGIQGFSEMIRDEDLSKEEMKEYASDIYVDARRLSRLINEMLDLDRMESGLMTLNPTAVDLNDIVRGTVERMAPNAPKHAITIDLGDLPLLSGDRDKLVQVVTNLLSNAVKYSPDGAAILVRTSREGERAHLTVRDHGLGIPANSLETIFERFARIETQTTRHIQGTGLGLPIVRQIAEMHGGRVWAESTLGEGSTFHLILPLTTVTA